MAVTVPNITTHRKPQAITHYAYLGDVYGTATLVNGSGYLFRADGERRRPRWSPTKTPSSCCWGWWA